MFCPVCAPTERPASHKIGSKACTLSPKGNRNKSDDQEKTTKTTKSNNNLMKIMDRDTDGRKKKENAAPENDLI